MLNERQAVTLLTGAAAITLSAAQHANACGGPPPEPPPRYWVETHGDTDGDGLTEVWIGIEIDIFDTDAPTTCSCGIGINAAATIPSLAFGDAFIGITNTMTHETTPLSEFDFSQNTAGSNGYQNGSGAQSGSMWQGYAASVNPVSLPDPDPDTGEVYKLWFEVEVAPVDLAALFATTAGVGSGLGNPDGSPNFNDPDHPLHSARYFRPLDDSIPTPGAAVVLAGGLMLLSRRGRALR